MEATTDFTDLIVWQRAHEFVLEVYKITNGFPKYELYGLTSQFRRAAVSIAANIAESYRKRSRADSDIQKISGTNVFKHGEQVRSTAEVFLSSHSSVLMS